MSSTVLFYDRPAERWFEALPIGNGRLGGMVYGGVGTEIVRLSESTAWSGAPSDTDVSPTALRELPAIRRLLFAGEYGPAQRLAAEHLPGRPSSFGTNLPLPRLRLDFAGDAARNYRRALDLDTGLVRVEFEKDEIQHVRETFASHPHGVIAMRLTADRPAAVSFTATLDDTLLPGETTTTETGLAFRGQAVESLHSDGKQGATVEIRARFELDGGTLRRDADTVTITGADAVVVLVGVGTDWAGDDPAVRAGKLVAATGYEELRAAHVEDHRRLMRRVSIDLGEPVALPTDVRRERLAQGHRDDDLIALYFQYGRYLTVAGSRADSPLPLALQGVWNDGLASSSGWTDDFHLDINTQQNYWAAEPANLADCHAPLFRFVQRLAETGRGTARQMYGADGWVAHTVANAWGYTAPGSGLGWGLNVTGGAWIALQLWEHYEYHPDVEFLREQAYPVLRDAALFLLSYLVPEPAHGWLVAGPSESPENWYLAPDGAQCSIAMGNTADRVFAEAILRICGRAAAILGVDPDLRERVAEARGRLSPFRIGRHGQLQEWLEDVEEADPAHRHTSHLCALFPERHSGAGPRRRGHPRTPAAGARLGADRVGGGQLRRLLRPPARRRPGARPRHPADHRGQRGQPAELLGGRHRRRPAEHLLLRRQQRRHRRHRRDAAAVRRRGDRAAARPARRVARRLGQRPARPRRLHRRPDLAPRPAAAGPDPRRRGGPRPHPLPRHHHRRHLEAGRRAHLRGPPLHDLNSGAGPRRRLSLLPGRG